MAALPIVHDAIINWETPPSFDVTATGSSFWIVRNKGMVLVKDSTTRSAI